MGAPRSAARLLGSAPIVSLGLLALYLALPNRQYAYDAIDYAFAARTGQNLFHPHHLLYSAFAHALHLALPGAEVLRLLATANGLITAGAALLLHRLVAATTGRPTLAGLIALGYGMTHGIWYMGTSVECYPMTLLAELGALAVLGGGEPPGVARLAAAGLLSAVAMLFHQTGIFFLPALAWSIAARSRQPWRAVLAVGIALALVGALYLAITSSLGIRGPRGVLGWILAYTQTQQFASGQWGGGLHPGALPRAVVGALGAMARPAFTMDMEAFTGFHPSVGAIAILVCLLGSLVALGTALRRAGRAPRRDRAPTAALWLWLALLGAFAIWWEAGNFEFWLLLLPPATLLIATRLARLGSLWPVGITVALLGVGNLVGSAWPAAREINPVLATLAELERLGVSDRDLVLSNVPDLDPYARYFRGRTLRVSTVVFQGDLEAFRGEISRTARDAAVWLLETETLEAHGQFDAAKLDAFYRPFLSRADVVGEYPMYGRTWRLYRLR